MKFFRNQIKYQNYYDEKFGKREKNKNIGPS